MDNEQRKGNNEKVKVEKWKVVISNIEYRMLNIEVGKEYFRYSLFTIHYSMFS